MAGGVRGSLFCNISPHVLVGHILQLPAMSSSIPTAQEKEDRLRELVARHRVLHGERLACDQEIQRQLELDADAQERLILYEKKINLLMQQVRGLTELSNILLGLFD